MTSVPVRTPVLDPVEVPVRRLNPDELCQTQKERTVKTIRRVI